MESKKTSGPQSEEKETLAVIDTLVESAPSDSKPIDVANFVVTDEDVARMEALLRQA